MFFWLRSQNYKYLACVFYNRHSGRCRTCERPTGVSAPTGPCVRRYDMTDNDLEEKERIARELTDKPFDELSSIQQNIIESCAKEPETKAPFEMLRRGDDA